jgi:hypothetical protein
LQPSQAKNITAARITKQKTVELDRNQRVQARKAIADIDRQAVLAAIGLQDREEKEHLPECERDHDEINAGSPE